MKHYFYHGIWRMDWGLGNPNKTAAVISMLMIAVWWMVFFRKEIFWPILVAFTVLGAGLIHTYSRGGIIALFFGIAPLLLLAPRPWPRREVIGIVASVWMMVAACIYLDAETRYQQGIVKEDRSISNRLEVWRYSSKMMVDAPGGWGLGNSGAAYGQWYQPLNETEAYRTLVGSHLTWLVEVGWPLRFLYVFSWAAIFLLCWPSGGATAALATSLGIWIAFGVAAAFSSVAESVWLWILPGIFLLLALRVRIRRKTWPKPILWLIPALVSACVMLLISMTGHWGGKVQKDESRIVLGGAGPPKLWIVINDKIMGANYARVLRRYLGSAHPGENVVGVVKALSDLPSLTNKTVVVGGEVNELGKFRAALAVARKIYLLNPCFFPQQIEGDGEAKPRISVDFGEFSQSPAFNAWSHRANLREIASAGDFIPDWPSLIFQRD